ncbi:MAG: hypothetical protein WC460_06750 [Patescibacteria group bacterium]
MKIYRIKLNELKKLVSPDDEEIPGFGKDYSEFSAKKVSDMIYYLIYERWNDHIESQLEDILKQKFGPRKIRAILDWVEEASNYRYVAEYGDKNSFSEDEPSEREIAEKDLEKACDRISKLLGFDFHETRTG